ncbi:PAP2 family protein [Natronococcus pandeyae]|uniref:PAP2 family protein n=1 Tax=Natronococcus pandeyae TaxID=2055836 RepID=A0A8J8Q175_9EURY|nr:phosphatase PAP2 family protein [Natronococcus pandeyae]TYL37561.1 PAP2 family protein [Natronococcus pandeyae]
MDTGTLENIFFDEATNEAVRASFPEPAIRFFELVTHLGDGATLLLVVALVYWFGSPTKQRTRGLVLAIALVALAVSAGLKGSIDAARPEVAFTHATYSPYSFPSGHALGSAAVYSAVAVYGRLGTRGLRYAVAGAIIVLVALSRIVIGAHFLGDALAGVVLGLGIVTAIYYLDPDPEPLFLLAGAIAIVSFAFGSTHYTTLTTGAAIGATLAWQYAGRRQWAPSGASLLVLGLCCLPALVALRLVTAGLDLHWIVDVLGYAVIVGFFVLVPAVGERLNDRPAVVRLQSRLPFDGRTVDSDQLSGSRE